MTHDDTAYRHTHIVAQSPTTDHANFAHQVAHLCVNTLKQRLPLQVLELTPDTHKASMIAITLMETDH